MTRGLGLSERWWGLRDRSDVAERKRGAVAAELAREIGPLHELHGQIDRVEAFFEASDDVIVSLLDGTFALVHPTWSHHQERNPYPRATRLGFARAATRAVADWEKNW